MSNFKKVVYAVAHGRKPGLYDSWDKCKQNVFRFPGAKFKSFRGASAQRDALEWIRNPLVARTESTVTMSRRFVYTDGSCINNGADNARGGVGVYYDDGRRFSFPLDSKSKQTNNVAELTAIIFVLRRLLQEEVVEPVTIVTDSKYSINALLGKRLDKTYPNKDIIVLAQSLLLRLKNVDFLHVKAHTDSNDMHSVGNRIADELAQAAAKNV